MNFQTIIEHGTRRIQHEISEAIYLKTGRDHTKPLSIRGMVNERCNYRCQYCKFWQMDEYQNEMTIAEWQAALLSLKQFVGRYTIQFSGGEPFIKKGFIDLLTFCHENGIRWGVITNGSGLKTRLISRILAAYPLNIDISVDGHTAEIHDVVRGIPGSLASLETAIPQLVAARNAAGQKFPIRIKPTVHKLNFRVLPQLVEWAMNIGATSIDFAPVRPWTPAVRDDLWLEESDIPALNATIDRLLAMRVMGAPIETAVSQMQSWAKHFLSERIAPMVVPCRAGLRDYHIRPNGDVSMCWHYPMIGNVLEDAAETIWYNERATRQRHAMVNCSKLGEVDCANSCLSHRPLRHEARRARLFRQ